MCFLNGSKVQRKSTRKKIINVFVHENASVKFVNVSESEGVQFCKKGWRVVSRVCKGANSDGPLLGNRQRLQFIVTCTCPDNVAVV